MKQTVFIKVDVKDRLPSESGMYVTSKGIVWFIKSFDRYLEGEPMWWMEEIEIDLPEKECIPYQEVQDDARNDGYNDCLDDLKYQLKIK